jgi:Tol biopolymer transport system component
MRSDGTRRRSLTSDAFVDRVPRWSPDKTRVASFASRNGPPAVWKIRVDGSDLQQVSETGGVPVWSPDGTRLATSPAGSSGRTTCVLDPNRPWKDQTLQVLPSLDETLRPFIAQDWSPHESRLVGQVDFAAPPSRGNGLVV